MTQRLRVPTVLLAGAAVALAGCGGDISAPTTTPVQGTVRYGGKPAAGVRVTFHPQFDIGAVKFTPSGVTDADGRFTLTTASPGDGAPVGDYVVTFDRPQTATDRAHSGIEIEVDAWKGKYSDPAAGRRVTVRTGENDLEPFKLD